MSSSDPNSTIFLTDTAKQIETKIKKHAFSGGQQDLETHRKLGANLEIDIPCAYLEFFLDDDEMLRNIKEEYKAGRMLTSEVKKTLIEILQRLVLGH